LLGQKIVRNSPTFINYRSCTELAVDGCRKFRLLLLNVELHDDPGRVLVARLFQCIVNALVMRVVRSAHERNTLQRRRNGRTVRSLDDFSGPFLFIVIGNTGNTVRNQWLTSH